MSIVNALRKGQIFSSLTDDDIARIGAISSVKLCRGGEMIFTQGDPAKGFYLISGGAVRIFQLSPGGKEHLLHIFREGETFGEAAAFSAGIFPACAEALEKSELIYIPVRGFKEILSANPALAVKIIGTLSSLLHLFVEKIEALTLKDAATRLAGYLLSLAKGGETFELPAKKGSVASELNMTQETFSRSLQRLRLQKIIEVDGRRITIKNPKYLKELIDNSSF